MGAQNGQYSLIFKKSGISRKWKNDDFDYENQDLAKEYQHTCTSRHKRS
jgi:hypothetical protein